MLAIIFGSGVTAAAIGGVMAKDISIEPKVLFSGDKGLISVNVMNSGSESVTIDRAELISSDLLIENYGLYDSIVSIGPGNSMLFTYTVLADVEDGVYYPRFYLGFHDGGSYYTSIPIKVESTELSVSVIDVPDSFSQDKKATIQLQIGNPRENTLNGITVTPKGDGIETTQKSAFVGNLSSDKSTVVSFDVIPHKASILNITVDYRNGINPHTSTITIPIEFSEDKTRAEIVVNNIEVASTGSGYMLTGDVANAGLEDAKSVLVTVGAPAKPINPNPEYVIGALEPDDFSSFELTFTAQGAPTVPLIVKYKDIEGNRYEETLDIVLNSPYSSGRSSQGQNDQPQSPRGGMFGGFGGGLSRVPLTEILIGLIAIVVVIIAWRKGLFRMIKNRIRRS
jgi:hypothetical protein